MKTVVLLLSVLALASIGNAAVTHLAPEYRFLLMQQGAFRVVAMSQIPSSIALLCADSNGRMAAPGERWEATDTLSGDNLPRKRFIWAATHNNYYLLHYERGGRAHSFHVVIAYMRGEGTVELLWHASATQYQDVSAFMKALASDQLSDNPAYAY